MRLLLFQLYVIVGDSKQVNLRDKCTWSWDCLLAMLERKEKEKKGIVKTDFKLKRLVQVQPLTTEWPSCGY